MSRIQSIIRMENKGEFALVYVMLNDGTEATVYVGGDVEVYFHNQRIKAFVKRAPNLTATNK